MCLYKKEIQRLQIPEGEAEAGIEVKEVDPEKEEKVDHLRDQRRLEEKVDLMRGQKILEEEVDLEAKSTEEEIGVDQETEDNDISDMLKR